MGLQIYASYISIHVVITCGVKWEYPKTGEDNGWEYSVKQSAIEDIEW
jgi:hypothetical protein